MQPGALPKHVFRQLIEEKLLPQVNGEKE